MLEADGADDGESNNQTHESTKNAKPIAQEITQPPNPVVEDPGNLKDEIGSENPSYGQHLTQNSTPQQLSIGSSSRPHSRDGAHTLSFREAFLMRSFIQKIAHWVRASKISRPSTRLLIVCRRMYVILSLTLPPLCLKGHLKFPWFLRQS